MLVFLRFLPKSHVAISLKQKNPKGKEMYRMMAQKGLRAIQWTCSVIVGKLTSQNLQVLTKL